MARAKDLAHRSVVDTALRFTNIGNPIATEPFYVLGSNVLTSVKGYLERRPGFVAYTADTFTGATVKRLFIWQKWGGAYYVMASVTDATTSKVYKLQIGTDTAFALVYNDTGSTEPFNYTVADNSVFFANGTQMWKYNGTGTSTTPWGIGTSPMFLTPQTNGKPTTTTSGTGITATEGYKYVYCYYNSTTGHLSNASNPSLSTGVFTNQQVTITLMKSSDTQVDKVKVFRTTDGGGGIYYEITGSPFVHTAGTGTMTVTDSTTDANLSSSKAPVSSANTDGTATIIGMNTDPQSHGTAGNRIKAIAWWNNRIWGTANNKLWYSGWEEIDNGNEEECFPDDNFFEFKTDLTAVAASDAGLLVFGTRDVFVIKGDSVDTFTREVLFPGIGARECATVSAFGGLVAWVDTADMVRITDGYTQKALRELDLGGIVHTTASTSFHIDGLRRWLLVADGSASKLWVYDMDKQQWMPSWAVSTVTALGSGETSAGNLDLLIGYNSTRVGQLTPSAYLDFGASYTAFAATNLWDLKPDSLPGHVADLEYVVFERNSIAPSDVKVMTDDDPNATAFTTSILANIATGPPLRTAGTNLVEEWYYHRTPAARRIAIRFDWAAANSNFRLYSFTASYNPMT